MSHTSHYHRHCAIEAALTRAVCLFATGLANICHQNDLPLIVDEAHGSHFVFDSAFPQVRFLMLHCTGLPAQYGLSRTGMT